MMLVTFKICSWFDDDKLNEILVVEKIYTKLNLSYFY